MKSRGSIFILWCIFISASLFCFWLSRDGMGFMIVGMFFLVFSSIILRYNAKKGTFLSGKFRKWAVTAIAVVTIVFIVVIYPFLLDGSTKSRITHITTNYFLHPLTLFTTWLVVIMSGYLMWKPSGRESREGDKPIGDTEL